MILKSKSKACIAEQALHGPASVFGSLELTKFYSFFKERHIRDARYSIALGQAFHACWCFKNLLFLSSHGRSFVTSLLKST